MVNLQQVEYPEKQSWEENCLTMLLKYMPTDGNSNILHQKTFRTMEDASAVDLDWFLEDGFTLLIL
jgi:hypothetical protein